MSFDDPPRQIQCIAQFQVRVIRGVRVAAAVCDHEFQAALPGTLGADANQGTGIRELHGRF